MSAPLDRTTLLEAARVCEEDADFQEPVRVAAVARFAQKAGLA
jgi:hypothetical protein